MLGIKQQQETGRQGRACALACNVMADASVTLTNSNCQLLKNTKVFTSSALRK